jgi:tRNA(fMet)-specific endonuclease VapC
MSLYILDTGILLGYIRAAGYAEYIEAEYSVSEPPNIPVISVVTIGEILSLAIQFKWGSKKKQIMRDLLSKFASIDI